MDSPMTSSPKKILEARHIDKAFEDHQVLKDVNLHLDQGELVAILGLSGSGKSTLFHIIAGLLKPDGGQVLLEGKDITGKTGQVSYMLQKDLLLPHLKILDNVALPLFLRKMNKKEAREKASSYFSQFGLEGTQDLYPSELSGGMAQRAALLRTYLFSSNVALLDEPFSKLDAITKSSMHQWYLDIMEEIHLSSLLITHDIEEAIKLANRIYILSKEKSTLIEEIKVDPDLDLKTKEGQVYQFELKKHITQLLGMYEA